MLRSIVGHDKPATIIVTQRHLVHRNERREIALNFTELNYEGVYSVLIIHFVDP